VAGCGEVGLAWTKKKGLAQGRDAFGETGGVIWQTKRGSKARKVSGGTNFIKQRRARPQKIEKKPAATLIGGGKYNTALSTEEGRE